MRATWKRRRAAWPAALVLGTCALALLLLVRPTPVHAATIVVDSQADTIAVDGACTLREAIQNANNDAATNADCVAGAGADTITLPAGMYTLTIAGAGEDAAATGDLDVTNGSTVAIEGAGAGTTTIQACAEDQLVLDCASGGIVDRVLQVAAGGNLTLDGVTVRHGNAVGNNVTGRGGGVDSAGTLVVTNSTLSDNRANTFGGGIYGAGGTVTLTNSTLSGNAAIRGGGAMTTGTLTVTDSTVSGNSGGFGGGLWNGGTLTVTDSTVSGNSASSASGGGGIYNSVGATLSVTNSTLSTNSTAGRGGGISNDNSSTLILTNSTISGNSAGGTGGGISNSNFVTVTVTNSTLSGNSADLEGGGIYTDTNSTVTLTNSTVSGNSTDLHGGGILNEGTATLTSSTISGNSADFEGGGVAITITSGPLSATNTIIADNTAITAGPDCVGTLTSVDTNLIEDTTDCTVAGAGAVINADPVLGPLADNGGPTQTHALLAGSPAIDAGDCTAGPATDQRGIARPQDATCDIGAYELQVPTAFTVDSTADAIDAQAGDGVCATVIGGGVCTLRAAIQEANASPGTQTVTFDAALDGTPITLTIAGGNEDVAATGDLDVTSTIEITGNGAADTIIQACAEDQLGGDCATGGIVDRVLHVIAGGDLTLDGVTVRHGHGVGGPQGIGGGIRNAGTLTVTDSTISANTADLAGGGIRNDNGVVTTLTNSTLSGNRAGRGGGIDNGTGTVTLTSSTVSGNTAVAAGGGIVNATGTVTLTSSTVSGNSSGSSEGGGIHNTSGGTVSVTTSTLSANSTDGAGGGIYNSGVATTVTVTNSTLSGNTAVEDGGGIYNIDGSVTVTDSTISANIADGNGGGIDNDGTVTLTGSTVSGNSATTADGGGIFNAIGATLLVTSSTISGNSADLAGGGIKNDIGGTVTLTDSALSDNSAGVTGGGIHNNAGGTVTLTNSTLSGNGADFGGGILNGSGGTVTLTSSTISGNSAAVLGGGGFLNQGTLSATNTIIADNTAVGAGPDCSGDLTSVSTNLIEDPAGCTVAGAGTVINADPLLGTLDDNGGPTQTHALLLGSPAIDAGDCTSGPATDQRGLARPQDATCDIGAYEALQLTVGDVSLDEGDAGTTDFDFTVTLSSAVPAGFPAVEVDWETADGTAQAGSDYTAAGPATLTFAPGGAATQNVTVTVTGDTDFELDEAFVVDLSAAIGAVLTDAQATGTIQNDDAAPGDFIVDSTLDTADATPGDGACATAGAVCTLRAAVQEANALAGAQTVTFDAALDGATITLGSILPTITDVDGLMIDGAGEVTISGNNAVGIFRVDGGLFNAPPLEIRGLTLANGRAGGGQGGGAVHLANGELTVIDSVLRDNDAVGNSGGAIRVAGVIAALTVRNSTFSGNEGGQIGGAIAIAVAGSPVAITNSTFSGNTVSLLGRLGGAVSVGPGIDVSFTNVTVTGNSAGDGGGIHVNASATISLTNTIIAGNTATTAGPDCSGTITSVTASIVQDASGCTAAGAANVDPVLGPLADNGGPVTTHALLAGSPALDAGDNAACAALPGGAFDARGIGRPQGTTCDIGAYEALLVSIADVTEVEGNAGGTAFDVTVLLFAGFPAGFPDITLDYSTADGTAAAPGDYAAVGATQITFTGGAAPAQTFTITVAGDTSIEPDETFFVNLSNATGAIVTDAQALITITNDDVAGPPPPTPAGNDDGPAPPGMTLIDGIPVQLVDEQTTTVQPGQPATVQTTAPDGSTATVIAPPGTLPPGTTLSAAATGNLDAIVEQAPPPDGTVLVLSFVFEATGPDGTDLRGPFDPAVELTFTLPAASVPDGATDDTLVLVYWDGEQWVEVVDAVVTIDPVDGTATITVSITHFTVFAVLHQADRGTFSTPLFPSGVTLTIWRGGGYAALDAALGARGGAVWVASGGRWYGYVAGAPAFVNASFLARYPDGVPTGTPLVVAR